MGLDGCFEFGGWGFVVCFYVFVELFGVFEFVEFVEEGLVVEFTGEVTDVLEEVGIFGFVVLVDGVGEAFGELLLLGGV